MSIVEFCSAEVATSSGFLGAVLRARHPVRARALLKN